MADGKLYVHFTAYEDEAELDVDYSGPDPVVENHEQLVEDGLVYDEVRVLTDNESNRNHIHPSMIVEEGDPLWREEFADMDVGDAYRFDEQQIVS